MHYLYIIGIDVNVLSGERVYNMAKYIVYGQRFEDEDEEDYIGSRVEKIAEYDNEDDANDRLAYVRQNAEYEYEWIEER